jgi:hypothetical protein
VADREFQRDGAAHAVPEHVRTIDAEVVEQRDHIASQGGRGDLALDVRGAPVPLQLVAHVQSVDVGVPVLTHCSLLSLLVHVRVEPVPGGSTRR